MKRTTSVQLLATLVGMAWIAGCGGDAGVDVKVSTPRVPLAQIHGTVVMPNGSVAAGPGSPLQRLAAALLPEAAALSGNVSHVGAGVPVSLVLLHANGSQDPTGDSALTNVTGSYSMPLPPQAGPDTCRYVVQVGNGPSLTRAFVTSTSASLDIDYASEAAVRMVLKNVAAGDNLCNYSSSQLSQLVTEINGIPGDVSGANAAEVNDNAYELASNHVPPLLAPYYTPTARISTPTRTPAAIVSRLTRTISATDTKIPVADICIFPDAGAVKIDNEVITYNGTTPGHSLCTARAGTSPIPGTLDNAIRASDATSHLAGSIVELLAALPTPIFTPTSLTTPSTPAGTNTFTPIPTLTPTAIPCTPPAIQFNVVDAPPNTHATITATLRAGSAMIVGTQNDFAFDSTNIPIPRRCARAANAQTTCSGDADCPSGDVCSPKPACYVNPDINKSATSFAYVGPTGCSGSACGGIRAIVLATDNVDAIADGSVLFTCTVSVGGSANSTYPIAISGLILGDASGNIIPNASGCNGAVVAGTVPPPGTQTATPIPTTPGVVDTATPINTPIDTPTNTPTTEVVLTSTPTHTPTTAVVLTATPINTPTNTEVLTATPTNTGAATPTDTPIGLTATPTNTGGATPTDTPIGLTATPTNTGGATPTNTPIVPTPTTVVPATATLTPITPPSPSPTTPVAITPTRTPTPAATASRTPTSPPGTPTRTPTPTATPTRTIPGPSSTPAPTLSPTPPTPLPGSIARVCHMIPAPTPVVAGNGTGAVLSSQLVALGLPLSGAQVWQFGPVEANGKTRKFVVSGSHFDCAGTKLGTTNVKICARVDLTPYCQGGANNGRACPPADCGGSPCASNVSGGVVDCSAAGGGFADYNGLVQVDHNTNKAPGLPADPTCVNTFAAPDGSVMHSCIEPQPDQPGVGPGTQTPTPRSTPTPPVAGAEVCGGDMHSHPGVCNGPTQQTFSDPSVSGGFGLHESIALSFALDQSCADKNCVCDSSAADTNGNTCTQDSECGNGTCAVCPPDTCPLQGGEIAITGQITSGIAKGVLYNVSNGALTMGTTGLGNGANICGGKACATELPGKAFDLGPSGNCLTDMPASLNGAKVVLAYPGLDFPTVGDFIAGLTLQCGPD